MKDFNSRYGCSIFNSLSLIFVIASGNSNHSILNRFREISLSNLYHLCKDHGGDLLRVEFLSFTLIVNGNHGLITSAGLDLKGPVFDVFLNLFFAELSTNKSLGIKNCILRVSGSLILCGTTNETLHLSEGDA
jgi:hypothetical protein